MSLEQGLTCLHSSYVYIVYTVQVAYNEDLAIDKSTLHCEPQTTSILYGYVIRFS